MDEEKVYKRSCKIISKNGIHARPCSVIVQILTERGVGIKEIFITKETTGYRADAFSVLEMLQAYMTKGDKVIISGPEKYADIIDRIYDVINNTDPPLK